MPSPFEFNAESPVYKQPTENLRSTLGILDSHFGISGKKVLTVAGSGDFIIGYLQKGAASVLAVDISSSASAFAELKATVFFTLPPEEFTEFQSKLWEGDIGTLSQAYSQEIRKSLSGSTRLRLDPLFESGNLPKRTFRSSKNHIDGYLPYSNLDDRVSGLKKFRISNSSLEEALIVTNEKFDFIHCSNLLQYIYKDSEAKTNSANALRLKLSWLRRLRIKLRKDGVIADYCFSQNRSLVEAFRAIATESGMSVQVFNVLNLKGSYDFLLAYSKDGERTIHPGLAT